MRRFQQPLLERDLEKKLVFLVGPRQVGKTWLAHQIGEGFDRTTYLNYDRFEDRKIIKSESWLPDTQLLILDELHKMAGWKRFLKGVYDTRPPAMRILVTGSARLDAFRQTGDSMAGRFFSHRLMPFSPAALVGTELEGDLDRLLERGGFPEPLLAEDPTDAARWRLQYVDGLIREDVLDFERIHDLGAMRTLVDLLRTRVGSPLSYASIARDLGVAPNTVKKYVHVLEALYIVFRVAPHSRNVARSLLKAPKLYFFDSGLVTGAGARLENLTAVALYDHALGRVDRGGVRAELRYLRTKTGREVDFCLVEEGSPRLLVEVKNRESTIEPSLAFFAEALDAPAVQAVRHLMRERMEGSVAVRRLDRFLAELRLPHTTR